MLNVGWLAAELFLASAGAGLVGSLSGLGGGVLLVPILTVGLGMDVRHAVGASIVAVIATSSGSAASHVRERLINLRVAVLLELATSLGGLTGALLAPHIHPRTLFLLFGIALLASLFPTAARLSEELPRGVVADRLARALRLGAAYPEGPDGRMVVYEVSRVPAGFGMMYVAGVISGLLGIGSGALKVLAMDTAMRLPMKVSTATSNLMIGVTAAASAAVYFWRGDVVPLVAGPVALGAVLGATLGAKLVASLTNRTVRLVFVPVLTLVAVQMLVRGL